MSEKPENQISVGITLGNGQEMGINHDNYLIIQDRHDQQFGYINLGPFTKARANSLCEYLQRLAIHVE